MPNTPDEDLIEATIRRIAEERAARESAEAGAGAFAPDYEAADDAEDEAPPPLDPGEIEARIRRASGAEPAAAAEDDLEPDPAFATLMRQRQAAAARPERPAAGAGDEPEERRPADWVEATWRIERAVSETQQALRELIERFDAVLPSLEALASNTRAAAVGGSAWEQAVARAPMAPRPAPIVPPVRPLAPPVAAPEEPAAVDTRPLPKPLPPLQATARRGLDLLPRTYRITVEDKRRGVDLVPLHRALLAMDGVKDMSLLSYNNGVALVSIETTEDIDPEALGQAVSRAMSREAQVEVHNEHTMVVKLAEE
jgi:hypothetical protein